MRGDGGYVLAPGSVHENGTVYEPRGTWPAIDDLPTFNPAWVAEPSVSPVPRPAPHAAGHAAAVDRARAYLQAMGPAIQGQGGDLHTYRASCALVIDFALDDGSALELLREWNASCVPPWTEADLAIKVRSASRSGTHPRGAKLEDAPGPPASPDPTQAPRPDAVFKLTDSGNAEYFAHHYGTDLRYDHRRSRWLMWNHQRWQPDGIAAVRRLAKLAMRQRLRDAARLEDGDARTRLAKWALSSEIPRPARCADLLAQAEPPIADTGDEWDRQPMLLGVRNGVVDLCAGTLRAGARDDRITMSTAVAYKAEATCPRWTRFVQEIFASDKELVDYVHRALGYSISGDTSEQIFFVDVGAGANGKGTLLTILSEVMGDYAYTMPFATVELTQRTAIPNDLAALVGRRFVIASESNDGSRLNEARLKALTGCDPITARFLHSEFFTFRPVAKFWLSVNHKPIVRDDSHGFWRRLRLIPFTQTFPVNRSLADELRAEAPGILAWLIRGCLAWQGEGLVPPPAVLEATEIYETDSDPLAAFLDEAIDRVSGSEVSARDLYAHYRDWANRRGYSDRERLTANGFGRKMAERFQRVHTRSGSVYSGLARRNLVTDSDQ